ncbi:hypothetical protein HZ994_15345 [Akkermansiaceae bacterium]|nr:hypothetical protein HZ994_15345 [Akkermansiaceae bacterium]
MKSLLFLAILSSAVAAEFKASYRLDDILLPAGVPPEVGGITFGPDGFLYVCLRRSDVFRAMPVADPKAFGWKHFASGFHNGCGIVSPEAGKILVSQMAELTSAADTDGDGVADQYRKVADDWGLSGNYHETNHLTPDGKGGYFLAIGTASYNGPTFEHTKGEYSEIGRRGRNFSAVKNRGWVLHVDSNGIIRPWASGFRMHNGIYTDPDGETWCGDNQGDWKAVTPFYHVEKGKFYGHPASLVWDRDWPADKDPTLTYRNDLDAYNRHRTEAAVLIPHGFCRSASEPAMIPRNGSFGEAYAGQYILPDNNGTRLCRIAVEKINGRFQGMATYLQDGGGLRSGNNRLAFSPDGKQLYIGQTVRGWGKPAEGLQRITYLGGTPFDVKDIRITRDGFRLNFTADVPEIAADSVKVSSAVYQSKWTYGNSAERQESHKVGKSSRSGARSIDITLSGFVAGKVYEIKLPELVSADGSKLHNRTFHYTAHNIPGE